MGFDPTDDEVRAVTREVKDTGATGEEITDERLTAFAKDHGVKPERERMTEGRA